MLCLAETHSPVRRSRTTWTRRATQSSSWVTSGT